MLRLSQIALPLEADERALAGHIARKLDIAPERIRDVHVVRRALDARHKPRLLRIVTADFAVDDEEALLRNASVPQLTRAPEEAPLELVRAHRPGRVLVVGMGPAGLFAAWRLAEGGMQVTLIERGRPVDERALAVERFWRDGLLDGDSNVQFGEGGAGAFSDGKLTTRLTGTGVREVLSRLVLCGAPDDILVEAHPHIGTDRLRRVLVRLREKLEALGVTIRFSACLTGISAFGARINDCEEFGCDALVLACGHSARDTVQMLHASGVALAPKAFAVGLRVEHPAELINTIQWGVPRVRGLDAADYHLSHTNRSTGRGVYSFCMCPGGFVIAASSEYDHLVVNGMSHHARDNAFSNSALVVTVRPEDFPDEHPLSGIAFQREWERRAFTVGGGGYYAPAQNLLSFLKRGSGPVRSSIRPGFREADLARTLPAFVVRELREALPYFNRLMPGFVTREATLVGIESRTSAPFRILRDERGASISHPWLYPAGEGAGYAGGIVSSAADGLKAAGHILETF